MILKILMHGKFSQQLQLTLFLEKMTKKRACNDANNDANVNLETSMRRSDFIIYSVQLMYYKCHKVNVTRGGGEGGGSYIDSSDSIKKKKRQ